MMQNIEGIRIVIVPKNMSFVNTSAQPITQSPPRTHQSLHPTKAESVPAETTDAIHPNCANTHALTTANRRGSNALHTSTASRPNTERCGMM
jgi:hypothetical protein